LIPQVLISQHRIRDLDTIWHGRPAFATLAVSAVQIYDHFPIIARHHQIAYWPANLEQAENAVK
jgi:hypothetical protein